MILVIITTMLLIIITQKNGVWTMPIIFEYMLRIRLSMQKLSSTVCGAILQFFTTNIIRKRTNKSSLANLALPGLATKEEQIKSRRVQSMDTNVED